MKNSVKVLSAIGVGMGTIVVGGTVKAIKKAKKFKAEKKEVDENFQPVMVNLYEELSSVNEKQQHEVKAIQEDFSQLRKQARTREEYTMHYEMEKLFLEEVIETFKQHYGEPGVNPGCLVLRTKYQQIQIEKLQRQINKERRDRRLNDALTNI